MRVSRTVWGRESGETDNCIQNGYQHRRRKSNAREEILLSRPSSPLVDTPLQTSAALQAQADYGISSSFSIFAFTSIYAHKPPEQNLSLTRSSGANHFLKQVSHRPRHWGSLFPALLRVVWPQVSLCGLDSGLLCFLRHHRSSAVAWCHHLCTLCHGAPVRYPHYCCRWHGRSF